MNAPATLRAKVEDFVVEELAAYEPSGEGEHLFVEITKTNLTTLEAVRRLCRALSVEERGAGYAGMKDRRAIATQTISVPFAAARSIDEALGIEADGMVVRSAKRHRHKLRPGQLKANRFSIVLRDLPEGAAPDVVEKLEEAGRRGVPNAFGPQRFGNDGDNPERALGWLAGRAPGPRDRREKRLLFSALQAHLFNQVLDRRRHAGTWDRPLLGDLLKKTDTGGLFLCTDPTVDGERASRHEVTPTGPIFGSKMRWPEGEPAKIEREILTECVGAEDAFLAHSTLGEGTRRPLVLRAGELAVEKTSDPSALRVVFVLPKGGYATTLLSCAVELHEPTVPR